MQQEQQQQHKRFEVTLTMATEEQAKEFDPRSEEVDPETFYSRLQHHGDKNSVEYAGTPGDISIQLLINLGHPYGTQEDYEEERVCDSSYIVSHSKKHAPFNGNIADISSFGDECNEVEVVVVTVGGKPSLHLEFKNRSRSGFRFGIDAYDPNPNVQIADDDSKTPINGQFPGFYLTNGSGKTLVLWEQLWNKESHHKYDFHYVWSYFYVDCKVGKVEECTGKCTHGKRKAVAGEEGSESEKALRLRKSTSGRPKKRQRLS